VTKVAAMLQAKKLSPFEFYCLLDVNNSGSVSKIELKTGMQSIGISITSHEFNEIWKMIKKPTKKIQ
jgi:Ca2+-binding EF-hand superfamily protein